MLKFFSNLTDKFKAKDFHIAANKKLKTIQAEFKENFGLTLRIYKGKQLADPEMTIAGLNKKTSSEIHANNVDLSIKASLNIGEFEKLIENHFGLTIQVANEFDSYCVNNKYTLGQASRKEDLIDWLSERGINSIDEFLTKENCASLEEYYNKQK
ncbi:MAG: hypothetical protein ACEQR5_08605 [Moraxellaceae bacterium]|jgi:hypothetical protein